MIWDRLNVNNSEEKYNDAVVGRVGDGLDGHTSWKDW